MALRLRVVSEQGRSLGDRDSVVFSHAGGTIGRGPDNDWVLPDPYRYLSGHHVRLSFRDGHYLLEDLSTNGTFINDDEQPLLQRGPYRLRNGDVLRLGDYQIAVMLDTEAERPPLNDIDALLSQPTKIHALRPVGRTPEKDIGAAIDLNALLQSGAGTDSNAPPAAASGGTTRIRALSLDATSRRRIAGGTESALEDELENSAIHRRIERLAKAVERKTRTDTSLPAMQETPGAFSAFCRGAGLNAGQWPAESHTRLMQLVGQLMREALVGLKDLERSRQEIRNRFHIDLPVQTDDPRPSFARLTVDELLIELFNQHQRRQLDAVQWLREAVRTAKEHERAMSQATRAAFVEFLDRLDPAELEARFQRAARRGKTDVDYWNRYTEFYRSLIEMPADHLPHTFVEEFARAYRERLKEPQQ